MKTHSHIHKSHNVNLLMYHIVCVAKYRRSVFNDWVEETIKQICIDIEKRYEISFIQIWADDNHIHFLVQSVPIYSPKKIVQMIKNIIAREIFKYHPHIKKILRWWEFRTDGYYINTVWWYWNVEAVMKYVQQQGKWYKSIYKNTIKQLSLFDYQ